MTLSKTLQELATAPRFYIHTVGIANFFLELRDIFTSYNSQRAVVHTGGLDV